jgi:energy-coupling factor transport system substrate-specific component
MEENMKGIFKVTTRTIVAAGLGAALFTLLFMFVKILHPSPKPVFRPPTD